VTEKRSRQPQIPAQAAGRPRRPLTLTWEDDFAGHPDGLPELQRPLLSSR
jgi:hypothetical protein